MTVSGTFTAVGQVSAAVDTDEGATVVLYVKYAVVGRAEAKAALEAKLAAARAADVAKAEPIEAEALEGGCVIKR